MMPTWIAALIRDARRARLHRWSSTALGCTLALCFAAASVRAQSAEERKAVLARTPAELPAEVEGRWTGLFEGSELDTSFDLAPELLQDMGRAQRAYRDADYPGALIPLYAALERDPGFPPALLMLGNAYFRMRRYGDVVTALERFHALAPKQVFRTQALGHGYYGLGRYEEALVHYELVIARMRELGLEVSPEALRGLGLSHMRLGATEQALTLLRQVVDERPGHADALAWIAQILYDEERPEEALVEARRARNLAPYEPRPWFLLAQILLELGREEESEEARVRWQELDRVEQEVRGIEGSLLFEPGNFAAALKLIELNESIGNVLAVRSALELATAWRPVDVPEMQVRIVALETLARLGDAEGAGRAAQVLERCCSGEVETWRALVRYFGAIGEAELEVRALQRLNQLQR